MTRFFVSARSDVASYLFFAAVISITFVI